MSYSKVYIEYTGYLEDGTLFDQSSPDRPLEIVHDRQTVMEPIMNKAFKLSLGEEAVVDIPFEKAYGAYDPQACVVIPRSFIPDGDKLYEGQSIIWHTEEKPQPVAAKVVDADDDAVRIDFNHPLAGKNLTYRIKLVDAVD